MEHEPEQVLFLSDVVHELDAAHQVGLKTYELRRDDQSGSNRHPVASHFEQIDCTL
jgi:enolase-phosphatase E1